jgi:DNA topoisomerase-1
LVGYKASPLLWKSIKTGLSAGRVQTVALRLICEREDEIRKFVAQEYWTIAADLEKDGQAFQARLHKLDGHKPEIKDEATAQAIVADVAKLPFVVSSVERGERRRKAPAPFTTSTMQQEAAKQLGFSAGRTMRAAQKLYEGIEIGDEGAVGLITYMRTDSVRVSDAAITQAREYINAQFDKRYLPAEPNVYKGGRGSKVQDAHEAIRPTEVGRRPEEMKKYLESDLFKLYQLIWRRFVASQMTPAVYEATKVDFELEGGRFVFRGKRRRWTISRRFRRSRRATPSPSSKSCPASTSPSHRRGLARRASSRSWSGWGSADRQPTPPSSRRCARGGTPRPRTGVSSPRPRARWCGT